MNMAPTVGIASHVQPMPAPPLAVMRRSQQQIDLLLPCICCCIVDESVDNAWRRSQSDHVEVCAAYERAAVRLWRRLDTLGFKSPFYERIDRVRRPAGVAKLWNGMPHRFLKCPPF